MRLQLAIPENTFLSPVAFNRMLSLYGATAIFLFALPLVARLLLLRGAAADRRPRDGAAAARPARRSGSASPARPCSTPAFLFTPSEAGVNPLPPLSELAFLANNGVDAWASATGLATLGFVLIAIDLVDDAAQRCGRRGWPGGGCRSSPGPRRSAPG